MKICKKLYLVTMLSATFVLFILLFSFTATADSVCGSGWTWTGGPSYCPTCCRDLGNGLSQCKQPLCVFPTPKQLSPTSGTTFSNYLRTTTLKWSSVSGAASYSLEVEYGDSNYKWWASAISKTGLKTTSYKFDVVGAQPGRWRVWAVDANGYKSAKSPWWYFRYKI